MKTFTNKLLPCIIFMIAILIPYTSQAEVIFYIDSDAPAGGDGKSHAAAWVEPNLNSAQINAIETEVQNNDVVIKLDNGDEWNYSANGRMYLTLHGTSQHWITIDGTSWGENESNTTRAKIKFNNIDDGVKSNGVFIASQDKIWPDNPNNPYDAYLKVTGLEIEGDDTFGKNDGYSCLISTVNANHVWIDNCVVHGTQIVHHTYGIAFRTNPAKIDDEQPVVITDLKATRNVVYDVASSGIAFYPGYETDNEYDSIDGFLAEDNVVYDYGKWFDYAAGISIVSASNGIVANNRIYGGYQPDPTTPNAGYSPGICIEARRSGPTGSVYMVPTNVIVESNLIGSNEPGESCRVGVDLLGSSECVVRNNIIINTDREAIKVNAEIASGTPHPQTDKTKIYNNTIVNCGVLSLVEGANEIVPAIRIAGTDTDFRNNIVYQSGDVMSLKLNSVGSFIQDGHANNIYFNATMPDSIAICDGDNCSGDSIIYADVKTWEATANNTNPYFTNFTEIPSRTGKIAGFAPTYGGSACSSGQNLSTLFTNDFEGRQRMGAWDIGAAICNSAPLVVHIGGEFLQQD